ALLPVRTLGQREIVQRLRVRGQRQREHRDPGAGDHSTFTPASCTTLRHTSISFLIRARNCSGVPPAGERPSLWSCSSTSGDFKAFAASPLTRSTIARGSPLGPARPYQTTTS